MKASIEDKFEDALRQYTQGILVSTPNNNANVLLNSSELPNDSINGLCVAYSGGLDSTVLLHMAGEYCKNAQIPLTAFHVNHGISDNAQAWQEHCQKQCAERNIPFYTQALKLKKTAQQSLEADARNARYHLLDKFAGPNNVVLLAQHQDDQAETVLLQLKRGAGVKGLSAMPIIITRASGVKYLRPLLSVDREQILTYAKHHKLTWVEDESNQDLSYDRNFLRNKVFPLLTDRWPAFNKTMARSARNCAQAYAVNTEYMHLLSKNLVENSCIKISDLNKLSLATKECFVRYWLLDKYALTPTSAQLSDILSLTEVLAKDGVNAAKKLTKNPSPYIALANCVIERYQDKLIVIPFTQQSSLVLGSKKNIPPTKIEWNEDLVLTLNDAYSLKRVSLSSANKESVFALPSKGVEYVFGGSNISFKYKTNRPTKALKSWYQEWGVSPIQRQLTPVFIYNNKAIVVGLDAIKVSAIEVEQAIHVELCKSMPI